MTPVAQRAIEEACGEPYLEIPPETKPSSGDSAVDVLRPVRRDGPAFHRIGPSMAISKRVAGFGAVILVFAALGAGVYLRLSSDVSAEDPGGDGAGPVTSSTSMFSTDVAIAVEGAEAVLDTLVLSVSASGQAEAWRRAAMTAEVGGAGATACPSGSRTGWRRARCWWRWTRWTCSWRWRSAERSCGKAEASTGSSCCSTRDLPEDVRAGAGRGGPAEERPDRGGDPAREGGAGAGADAGPGAVRRAGRVAERGSRAARERRAPSS
jgi:hypothetical protein